MRFYVVTPASLFYLFQDQISIITKGHLESCFRQKKSITLWQTSLMNDQIKNLDQRKQKEKLRKVDETK